MIDFVSYDKQEEYLLEKESSCFSLRTILKEARRSQMERIAEICTTGLLSDNVVSSEPFEHPAVNDVLCGKDKTYGSHPGNQRFREMIESFAEVYKGNHSKQDKMKITRTIVAAMKQRYNTRFIKRVKSNGTDMWEPISDAIARDKVSHALRFAANITNNRKAICKNKKKSLNGDYCENDDPMKLLQAQKRSKGSLLQENETVQDSGHFNQLEFKQPDITGFQQCLRRDTTLGSMGFSQILDSQYTSGESILRFQRSISNEPQSCFFDIEPAPLNDPCRQSFLHQQTSIGNIEALLSSMRSEDLQMLMQDDIEKDWV